MAAEDIFGPEVGILKGKTTCRNLHTIRQVVEPLEPSIMKQYCHVTLGVDMMFINGIAFLVTVSRHIKFGTIEAIISRKRAHLLAAIKSVAQVYQHAGFKVTMALMDGEFEMLRGDLADINITLNTTARDEHVGDVERYIRTIKERMRAVYNTLPYRHMLPRLIIEMAKHAVFWLNAFCQQNRIGANQSPWSIIVGTNVSYSRHCKYQFGEYMQMHKEHDNSMMARTIGVLALHPTGNVQGSFYFFSLSTGRVIT